MLPARLLLQGLGNKTHKFETNWRIAFREFRIIISHVFSDFSRGAYAICR